MKFEKEYEEEFYDREGDRYYHVYITDEEDESVAEITLNQVCIEFDEEDEDDFDDVDPVDGEESWTVGIKGKYYNSHKAELDELLKNYEIDFNQYDEDDEDYEYWWATDEDSCLPFFDTRKQAKRRVMKLANDILSVLKKPSKVIEEDADMKLVDSLIK